ncbi:3-isopropylmalate dehydrogenase [Stomatohabitans albus]|uniref:3-isopropylmalate dehydrogenase n=1 Tax=Stomatohabitans albus TaxID=3110766 RepID=UPI00300C946A
MNRYTLAIVGGDGIGPEVTAEALKVLDVVQERFEFSTERVDYDLGGRSWKRTGEVLPASVQEELSQVDAILLGAVGTPEIPPGVLERGLLLKLRFDFDQYVNLRPVKLAPGVPTPIAGLETCDLVVVRENTEGLYTGAGGVLAKHTPREVATQESLNTRSGIDRVLRYAFETASARDNRLTLCHKTNVLTFAGDLWMRAFTEMGETEFPQVSRDYVHVDAMCLYLVTDPGRFDVVVTDNIFGDIITDLGAAVQGGMGLAASGNLNPTNTYPSMFEPVHGSAPDIAGKGIANPVASVLSLAMCLNHLGEREAATAVENAALAVLGQGVNGQRTSDIGERIIAAL